MRGRVELVVFPEYAVTGCPDVEHQDVALVADEIVALYETLVELARRYALYLLAGYAEHSSGHIFSTAVLVGPEGVLAHYHTTHVVGDEAGWCSAGDNKLSVVDLLLGRVGVFLGTDLCFPEMARCLAIARCDLLAVPAGSAVPSSFALGPTAIWLPPPAVVDHHPHHFHLARQRAIENNCYMALASLPYPNGVGASGLFGPARWTASVKPFSPHTRVALSFGSSTPLTSTHSIQPWRPCERRNSCARASLSCTTHSRICRQLT